MATNNDVTAFGDIPKSEEFTAPVLVVSDTILNNTLPKLLNLVSSNNGPLIAVKAIINKLPNDISIATKIDAPLHFPISLAYAIGNDKGITSIKNISYIFESPVGFSNGCAELAP